MSGSLVASLILKLEDQLSGGLQKLEDQFEKLRGVAQTFEIPGLNTATEEAGALSKEISGVSQQLTRLQTVAKEAGNAMAAMGRMAKTGIQEAMSAAGRLPGKVQAFGEAGSNLVNRGMGAAAEGFAVYEPIRAYAERDKALRQQAVMEGLHGKALDAEIARLNTMLYNDAQANGVAIDPVIEARKDLIGRMSLDKVDAALKVHTAAAKAYGISPEILGAVTGALVTNMKIAPNDNDLGGGLAALAMAEQHGVFKMADFSHALPGVTGVAASLGMTGRKNLNEMAAGLEISTKMATDPTQAGVNFEDLLSYITSNRENNLASKKEHINMPELLRNASKHGINPFDAFMGELRHLTQGKSNLDQAEILSKMLTNQQARKGAMAILQNWDEFQGLQKTFDGVGGAKLAADKDSTMSAMDTQMQQLNNSAKQLNVTLGKGFAPVLGVVNVALGWVVSGLTWLNTNFPQTTSWVLGGIAAMLALAAVITLVGAVVPVFVAGWGVIAGVVEIGIPLVKALAEGIKYLMFLLEYFTGITAGVAAGILVLVAIFAACAYDIYAHWGRFRGFFAEMWSGVKDVFMGFVNFVAGIFTGNLSRSLHGLQQMTGGVAGVFHGMWSVVKQIFIDFGAWVDSWTGGLVSKITGAIRDALALQAHLLTSLNPVNAFDNSRLGRFLGLDDKVANKNGPPANDNSPAALGVPPARVDVHVHADPGTGVSGARSSDPNTTVTAPISAPARGATVSRP